MNVLKHRYITEIILLLILLLTISLPLYFFVFTKSNEETLYATDNTQETIQDTQTIQEKEPHPLKQCFTLQEGRDACYFDFCKKENPYLCAEELLDTIVRIEGPEQAMEALNDIMESDIFEIQTDGHQLSHIVGRATLRYYGLNEEAFVRCPIDFNFGCVHGFFERAFEKEQDPIRAVMEICEKYGNCYHGVGHGFMFYTSYNLMDALHICDQLPLKRHQHSCYSGVFMENVVGFFDNIESGDMGFIKDDILAPCNRVEDRYRNQCWREHGVYLIRHHNWSLQEALHFCLGAGSHTRGCMTSIGYLVASSEVQESLKGSFIGTYTEAVTYLCNQFPPDHIGTCQTVVIQQILIDDKISNEKASEFCLSFNVNVNDCFKKIGTKLIEVAYNNDGILRGCTMVPEQHRESCYEGADIHKETKDTSMIYE